MRLLAEEGIGADVSTLGELRFAQAAGIAGDELVVHGNNKSDEELAAAAAAGALVVVDSLEEVDRARAAGVTRTLIRVTPGIEADTHEKIRTGHHGSKFGLTPDDALEALRRAPETEGLHVHIGSQLRDLGAARDRRRLDRRLRRARPRRARLGAAHARPRRRPRRRDDARTSTSSRSREFAGGLLDELERAVRAGGARRARASILEPGRSLTARAGVTLYTVGSVKARATTTAYVAVDGGMSDNPRPALYGARYTALLADRADEPPARRLHGRRQALRVGRPADRARRAARAAPRRHPRRPRRPAPTRSR